MTNSTRTNLLIPLLAFAALTASCASLESSVLGSAQLRIAVSGDTPSGTTGSADGDIPDGQRVSPFDTDAYAVGNLNPSLLSAVQAAARDAQTKGVRPQITSGWRSADYQRQLLDEAVHKYGSLDQARQLVSTPELSRHVTGEAVDIGPTDAADWLGRNGSRYGLCQVYANEMWHFELLTSPGGSCPAMLTDASEG